MTILTFQSIVEATASANRILSVRPRKEEEDTNPPMPLGTGAVGVQFQDVTFSYKGRNVPVLTNLSLKVGCFFSTFEQVLMCIKIEPGQFAALVGATGCGKSTIIRLLERFYDPTDGRILFGDTPILEVETKSYRKNLSLVAQESTLYEGTIRENVALSVDDSEATDEAIERVCRSAQIHDFITSLSEGKNGSLLAHWTLPSNSPTI
jgi:ABC-type multidrug transport system fused ATPase/permease subunit